MDPNSTEQYSPGYYDDYAGTDAKWLTSYRTRRRHYRNLIAQVRRARPTITDAAEIGCGAGQFSYALWEASGGQIAIIAGDISEHALAIARNRLDERVRLSVLNAQAVDLPSSSVDLVVSLDVVEHLPEPEKYFDEAFRVLRSGGVLLFSTPNPQSLGARLKKHQPGAKGDLNIWFARRDPTHINIRPIDGWRALCCASGFEKVRDGSDFLWDIPYFPGVPLVIEKLLFVPSKEILSTLFGFWPWRLGENYYGIWRKP